MCNKKILKNHELEYFDKSGKKISNVSAIVASKLELAQIVAKSAGDSAGLRLTEITLKNVDISNGIEESSRFDVDLRYEVW